MKENCIEWLTGQDTISLTLTQTKYINKVKKLKEKYPDLVQIIAINNDGSMFAKLPLKSLKLSIYPPKEIGEEYRKKLLKALKKRSK